MKILPTDESLRRLIRRSWTVPLRPDPGFRAAVWARIEAQRRVPLTWGGWLRLNFAPAVTYTIVSVTLAGVSGGLLGAKRAEHEREQSIQRYVATIDPHQRTELKDAP